MSGSITNELKFETKEYDSSTGDVAPEGTEDVYQVILVIDVRLMIAVVHQLRGFGMFIPL